MEARVKERLTGAVVLVAIVVIVVPELLSGPKRRAPLPAGAHTVTIDLNGPHRLPPASPAPPAAAETATVAAGGVAPRAGGEVVPVEPAAAPAADPDPAGDVPAPPPETESVQGEMTATGAPRETPVVPPARPASEPARSAALKLPPAAPKSTGSTPVAVAGWVVQLGSFASRENAQKLVTELQHKGYSAFIAEYRGHDKVLFRVRIGPEQDRGRADALRMRLGHDGYSGSVTPHP
jgi:DedD protein